MAHFEGKMEWEMGIGSNEAGALKEKEHSHRDSGVGRPAGGQQLQRGRGLHMRICGHSANVRPDPADSGLLLTERLLLAHCGHQQVLSHPGIM